MNIKREIKQRLGPRIPTRINIKCRPYDVNGALHASDGVMLDLSRLGAYIETPRKYQPGTMVILRTDRSSTLPLTITGDIRPPTLGLAEVIWVKDMVAEDSDRFSMGVRYI